MGHKEAIIFILIFPHIIIFILKEKEKSSHAQRTQMSELKASLASHINIYIHAGTEGLRSLPSVNIGSGCSLAHLDTSTLVSTGPH